jgi:hypothetical protein
MDEGEAKKFSLDMNRLRQLLSEEDSALPGKLQSRYIGGRAFEPLCPQLYEIVMARGGWDAVENKRGGWLGVAFEMNKIAGFEEGRRAPRPLIYRSVYEEFLLPYERAQLDELVVHALSQLKVPHDEGSGPLDKVARMLRSLVEWLNINDAGLKGCDFGLLGNLRDVAQDALRTVNKTRRKTVVFVGNNGLGKSTLRDLILRLFEATPEVSSPRPTPCGQGRGDRWR